MSYNASIPQPNDDPALSQGQFLTNFSQLNNQFSFDHVPFSAGGNAGFHKKVTFTAPLNSDPSITSQQAALYTKVSTGGTVPSNLNELFYLSGSASSDPIQLTGLPITQNSAVTPTQFGFVTPWGMIINCGFATSSPVTFQVPYSSVSKIFTVLITNNTLFNNNVNVTSKSSSSFSYATFSGTNSIYYFVIGAE
jgi:hypothetical protein